jgi:proline racemase
MRDALNTPPGTVTIDVIDSHTGGEPTRVVTDGFPQLRGATLRERGADLASHHRRLATAIVDEPRGNEPMVGALLTEPQDARCVTGVIFFDRALVLGMCGHGMIGLVETLRRLGRIGEGAHLVETPAGVVTAVLGADGQVSFDNVVCRRLEQAIAVDVPSLGRVSGDIVYGGNTFFLVGAPPIDLDRPRHELLAIAADVMRSVHAAGFVDVDHVELFGPPTSPSANSRNFVLCPSGTYDRSPCGTGTSAKVAALAADGQLDEGATWVQQSITGSEFAVRYRWHDRAAGTVIPTVTGSATVTGQARLLIGPAEYSGSSHSSVGRGRAQDW